MFGFGGKKDNGSNNRKASNRHTDRKDNEAMWGFLDSGKRQSDHDAERGGR